MISENYLCNFSPTLVCLNILRFIYYCDSYHQIEDVFKYDLIFILTQYYNSMLQGLVDMVGMKRRSVYLLKALREVKNQKIQAAVFKNDDDANKNA